MNHKTPNVPTTLKVPSTLHVAGVDGCPGGWITVSHPLDHPNDAIWQIFETFEQLIRHFEQHSAIAIDIPIGLPAIATPGGRAADKAARSVLGARQSSVFAVPARAAITCTSYREACDAALKHSDPPRKVAKQTFNLFPKIREVDEQMTPGLQQKVIECHPEVAFWALNDRQPLAEPKKVKSSPYEPGLTLRRNLLRQAGFEPQFLDEPDCPRRIAGPDDLLDACAAAWTANRHANGVAGRFPQGPAQDQKGLRMEIVY